MKETLISLLLRSDIGDKYWKVQVFKVNIKAGVDNGTARGSRQKKNSEITKV